MSGPKTRAWIRIALRVTGVIVVLEAACALTLTAGDLQKGGSLMEALRERASELAWAWSPATRFGDYDPLTQIRHAPLERVEGLRVNEHGFIGNGNPDPALNSYPQKPAGVFRIVALGGGALAGTGAEDNRATLPASLERSLNRRAGAGMRFQVLNFGAAGGYSSTELAEFLFRVPYLEPDMVLCLDGYSELRNALLEPERQRLEHAVINWADSSYHYFNTMNRTGGRGRSPMKVFTFTSRLVSKFFGRSGNARLKSLYERYPYYGLSRAVIESHPFLANVTANNLDLMAAAAERKRLPLLCYLQPSVFCGQKVLTPEEEEKVRRWFFLNQRFGKSWGPETQTPLMAKGFEQLGRTYRELDAKYRDCPWVRFRSLTDIFDDEPGDVFVDTHNCNGSGYAILAERMAEDVLSLLSPSPVPLREAP